MTVSIDSAPDLGRIRRARVAVSIGFFIFGMSWALWAVHIPVVTQRLALDPALLGLALLNVGLGGVISQPLTGWMISRVASRRATIAFLPLCIAVPIVPIIATTVPMIFVGALLLGLIGGAANVAINTQATEVEAALGRPILSSFHGFFSTGGLSGALSGGVIMATGMQNGIGAGLIMVPLLAVSLLLSGHYLDLPPRPAVPRLASARRFTIPAAGALFLSTICFFTNTIEGSVGDWSALYLSTVRHLPAIVASSGYAVFCLMMAALRFAGGPLVGRLGERRVVLLGGVLIAIGMAVVVLSPWATLSPFGFALVAVGAANNYPVLISVGSRASAGGGVAAVATGGLLGFLIGPPVIGFVAHAMGLAAAIGMLSLVGLIVVAGAAIYRWPAALVKAGV